MCTVAESKKKKKNFFIRPVNKIIKSLSHLSSLSVTLSVTLSFLSQSLSHLISQNSLRQTSLPPPHASRHWLPHVADCLISSHLILSHATSRLTRLASHLISFHAADRLTPPRVSSHLISSHSANRLISSHLISRRWSLAHQAAGLKLIEATGLKPMELTDVVLVCDWWFFILFVIGDFVWSRLRKKIGDLGLFIYLFIFFLAVDWWWWWWLWLWLCLWLWLMVEVAEVGAVEVFW